MGKMYKSRVRFQFTPLREGRRVLKIRLVVDCYFNSRPSARGDIQISILFWRLSAFQFTPLREGRRAGAETKYQRDVFQFTPLREGRQRGDTIRPPSTNFNSRPSARGDSVVKFAEALGVFQFTPLREGRRRVPRLSCRALRHFNSRPSARGDASMISRASPLVFQFTPLREGRHPPSEEAKRPCGFQFTPLREGRRWRGAPGIARENFNSRPSARGDGSAGGYLRGLPHFNSRPSARGDNSDCFKKQLRALFQFTPLREGRRLPLFRVRQVQDISIHAPPRGATRE